MAKSEVPSEGFGELFGGLKPSRGAVQVVAGALELGIDPTGSVRRAVEQTVAGGKHKVCVKPNSPLGDLKQVVIYESGRQQGVNGRLR